MLLLYAITRVQYLDGGTEFQPGVNKMSPSGSDFSNPQYTVEC
jgi:hypothetical protein